MKHTLTPLEPPYPASVSKVLEGYPRAANGHLLSLFRVFANSMRFLAGKGVINLLDKNSPLSLREREIVILRVTANRDCEYEWGVHVTAFAHAARLSPAQVAATRLGTHHEACWSVEESLLIRCVDALCEQARIEGTTYAEFQSQWTQAQQLEILALCGNYHTVSFVANTVQLPPEKLSARFPEPVRAGTPA
jgi:alkylhydroperoxidase family enzyme